MRYGGTKRTLALLLGLLAGACAHDAFQARVDAIKDHVRAFYQHLEAGRPDAAVMENEKIEALARESGERVLKSRQLSGDNQVDRDWMLVKTANEAAAENWLALGRYFVHKKRYDQARGAYQRVLATYADAPYRAYADQARTALQDLNSIIAPAKAP